MKHFNLTSLALIFIFISLSTTDVYSQESLEYKLAVIEADGYVSEDDITVKRFRSLLSQLSNKYAENRTQIADMSVKARQILMEKGIKLSMIDLMEGMNQLYSGDHNLNYSEYAATYISSRDRGLSHTETIEGLKELLSGLGIY